MKYLNYGRQLFAEYTDQARNIVIKRKHDMNTKNQPYNPYPEKLPLHFQIYRTLHASLRPIRTWKSHPIGTILLFFCFVLFLCNLGCFIASLNVIILNDVRSNYDSATYNMVLELFGALSLALILFTVVTMIYQHHTHKGIIAGNIISFEKMFASSTPELITQLVRVLRDLRKEDPAAFEYESCFSDSYELAVALFDNATPFTTYNALNYLFSDQSPYLLRVPDCLSAQTKLSYFDIDYLGEDCFSDKSYMNNLSAARAKRQKLDRDLRRKSIEQQLAAI